MFNHTHSSLDSWALTTNHLGILKKYNRDLNSNHKISSILFEKKFYWKFLSKIPQDLTNCKVFSSSVLKLSHTSYILFSSWIKFDVSVREHTILSENIRSIRLRTPKTMGYRWSGDATRLLQVNAIDRRISREFS